MVFNILWFFTNIFDSCGYYFSYVFTVGIRCMSILMVWFEACSSWCVEWAVCVDVGVVFVECRLLDVCWCGGLHVWFVYWVCWGCYCGAWVDGVM